MSEPAWEHMWEVFHAALGTEPGQRSAFLDSSCGEDTMLRRRVERLLVSHASDGGILDRAEGAPLLTFDGLVDPLVGRRVGSYTINDVVGEGGMGIVYDARQEEPRRRVALKLIRPGMDTGDVVARFEAERQALAMMTHASIAKVFDAGAAEDGRPFFAMELVDGLPITRYCDEHGLGIDARLELFQQVCEGVHHAHQRGVIHRDLKPSNLLVTDEDGRSQPKIIDFGIAKAAHRSLTSETLRTTQGAWVGTPEYMSPEQLDGSDTGVDTRADVYALGVVLYELLCGALPFAPGDLRGAGMIELHRCILEDEPARPSARVAAMDAAAAADVARCRALDARALRRRLAGDLDWILLKALDKDRERRYVSVAALVADLRRHLGHEPVEAGPPRTTYRVAKFVRRHRIGTAFAAVVALLLVGFAVAMGVFANRIAAERDRANEAASLARQEARTAQQVTDFLVGIFNVSRPSEARGNAVTAREILDRGAEQVHAELADEPLVQARMMMTIADVYRQLGLLDASLALDEEALAIQTELLGEDHPETLRAFYGGAMTMSLKGQHAEALARLARLLELLEGEMPQRPALMAGVLHRLSITEHRMGDYESAQVHADRAVALYEEGYGPDHEEVAVVLAWAGSVAGSRGDTDSSIALQERALAVLQKKLEPDDIGLSATVNNLAIAYWQIGEYEAARPYFEQALAIWEKNYGPDHYYTASGLNNMGRLLTDMGEYEGALEYIDRAIATYERAYGRQHPETARGILNKGRLLGLMGDLGEAIANYQEGLEIREATLGPDHTDTAMALEGFAQVLRQAGDVERAGELEARAASIRGDSEAVGSGPARGRRKKR